MSDKQFLKYYNRIYLNSDQEIQVDSNTDSEERQSQEETEELEEFYVNNNGQDNL